MKTEMDALIGQVFQHYRNGKNYEIIGSAYCTERDIEVLLYKPLYEHTELKYSLFTRSYTNFFEQVEHEGKIVSRFSKV
jgi:hypothetical protein